MITDDTTNAFLIFESVDPDRNEDLDNALWTLASNIQKYLGGEIETYRLNKDNPQQEL